MVKQALFKTLQRAVNLILTFSFWLFLNHEAGSQIAGSMSQDSPGRVNISFGIKTYNPVHVLVDERKESQGSIPIKFTATNSTYYPFLLFIDFIQFTNLSPAPPVQNMKISHGLNNLFSCSIHVPGKGYALQYKYSYWITPSDKIIDREFPYLIPLKEGRNVISKKTFLGKLTDSFTGQKGDTVFCMRRGTVMAVPRTETLDFRLSGHDCLEVLHEDGTYMIYHNLKKSENLTDAGNIVLPGQPIGSISDSSYLRVSLIKIENEENVQLPQPIRYTVGKTGTSFFEEIDGIEKSVYPAEVVTREMKSRELKKFKSKK